MNSLPSAIPSGRRRSSNDCSHEGTPRLGAGFHPDRAVGRHHHPGHPARDRGALVSQLQGSRQQVGRAGQRARGAAGHRVLQRRQHPRRRWRRRRHGEEGFTLIELTIVLLILRILLTIAVPSYLRFKDRAAKTAAKADVAQTLRAVNSYAADNFPGAPNDPDTAVSMTDSGYT